MRVKHFRNRLITNKLIVRKEKCLIGGGDGVAVLAGLFFVRPNCNFINVIVRPNFDVGLPDI